MLRQLGSMFLDFFGILHLQRTRYLLLYSVIGGVIAVTAAFLLVRAYGVLGAAMGVLLTGLIYNLLLAFAPGGIWPLLRDVRTQLRPAHSGSRVSAISLPEGGS